MKKDNMMYHVAEWLLIVGGLNWGLALFGWNLVTLVLGKVPLLVTIVYAAVGLSALYLGYVKLMMKK